MSGIRYPPFTEIYARARAQQADASPRVRNAEKLKKDEGDGGPGRATVACDYASVDTSTRRFHVHGGRPPSWCPPCPARWGHCLMEANGRSPPPHGLSVAEVTLKLCLPERTRLTHPAGGKGRHAIAIVRDELGQRRHGPRDLGGGDVAHDAKHRQAAVVDLGDQTLGLLGGAAVFGRVRRVEQVERHGVGEIVEGGEEARLAAAHVVLLALFLKDEAVL
mmetsp:Transcript_43990/g.99469  ORF Transcript_43990/g.99469 Transcript_43990/m.99469 type:complete len:220 (+) Transcript_43990:65-724(+)